MDFRDLRKRKYSDGVRRGELNVKIWNISVPVSPHLLTSFVALKKIIVIQCFKRRKRLLSEGFMLHIKWTTWKKAFKLTNSINFTLTSLLLFRSTKTHGDTEEKRRRERDKNQTWRSTLNSFSFFFPDTFWDSAH